MPDCCRRGIHGRSRLGRLMHDVAAFYATLDEDDSEPR
jgi:hypothetical protein